MDNEAVKWSEVRQDDSLIVQLEQTLFPSRSQILVTMSGIEKIGEPSSVQLPWVRPVRTRFLSVEPHMELEVRAADKYRIDKGDTPSAWRLIGRAEGGNALRWLGAHNTVPPSIRMESIENALYGAALTGETFERDRIRARWVAVVDLPSDRPRSLLVRVAGGWTVESVSSPHGNVVRSSDNNQGHVIWLEPAELNAKEPVRLQVLASRSISPNTPIVTGPPGWIVKLEDARLEEAAYIQAPADREVQVSFDGRRRQTASLEDLELPASLLAEIPAGALWFAGHGGVPGVELRPRVTAFDAELLTLIAGFGTEGFDWESRIEVSPRGGELNEIQVRVAGESSANEIRWSIEFPDDEPANAVNASATPREGYTEWNINLGSPRSTTFTLVGKQRLQKPTVLAPLVMVPAAADQRAELRLGQGVVAQSIDDSFIRLPMPADANESARLGYAVDRMTPLQLARQPNELRAPMVCWSWDVKHLLGVSRQVTLEATARITGSGEFRFPLPARTRFLSVLVNEQQPPASAIHVQEDMISLDVPVSRETQTIQFRLLHQDTNHAFVWDYKPVTLVPEKVPVVHQHTHVDSDADLWCYKMQGQSQENILVWALPTATGIVLTACILFMFCLLGWIARGKKRQFTLTWITLALSLLSVMIDPTFAPMFIGAALALSLGRVAGHFHEHWRNAKRQRRSTQSSRSNFPKPAGFALDSPANRMGLFLLILSFAASFAAWTAHAQESKSHVYDVLIPLDTAGNVAGDVIYVPASLYQQLSMTTAAVKSPPNAHFVSARYSVTVNRPVDPTIGAIAINARWQIWVPDQVSEVFLPVPPETLQHLDLGDVSGMRRPWKPATMGSVQGIILQLPKSGLINIRAELDSKLVSTPEGSELTVKIPRVADAMLEVLYDTINTPPEVLAAHGVVRNENANRQLLAQLGPVDNIRVRWKLSNNQPLVPELRIEPRCWVHIGERHHTVEMEFDRVLRSNSMRFSVDRSEAPISTNSLWQIQNAEVLEGGRRNLTLVTLSDSPGPARLLWSIPAEGTLEETLQLPSVRIEDVPAPSRIVTGINAPTDWLVTPRSEAAEVAGTETLLSVWKGATMVPKSVYLLDTASAPLLSIRRSVVSLPKYEEIHRLHITGGNELRLRYEMRFTTSNAIEPVRLELPRGFQVDYVDIDQVPSELAPITQGIRRFLALTTTSASDVHVVTVEGRAFRSGLQFQLPHLRVIGMEPSEAIYEVVHDPGVRLQNSESDMMETLPFEIPTNQQLNQLILPWARWRLKPSQLNALALPNRLSIDAKRELNPANIVSVVRWNDGTWTQETQITIDKNPGKFVALEIPADWGIKDVRIEPKAPFVSQRSENGIRVLYILPSANDEVSLRFALRSTYAADVRGRVEIPVIRIRGNVDPRYHFVLPGRLTSQPLRWQNTDMRQVDVDVASLGIQDPPPSPVILQPSSKTRPFAASPLLTEKQGTIPPSAALREVWELHSIDDENHYRVRWDLIPGDARTVEVGMPKGSRCISVNSNGRAARWQVKPSDSKSSLQVITIELNLSQLGQQLDLLVAAPRANASLPVLLGAQVDRSLLHIMLPVDAASRSITKSGPWEPVKSLHQARQQAAIKVLQASVDAIADRPRNEVVAWLTPWIPRLVSSDPLREEGSNSESNEPELPQEVANLLTNLNTAQSPLMGTVTTTPHNDPRIWKSAAVFEGDAQPTSSIPLQPAQWKSDWNAWKLPLALFLSSIFFAVLLWRKPNWLRHPVFPCLVMSLGIAFFNPVLAIWLVALSLLLIWSMRRIELRVA